MRVRGFGMRARDKKIRNSLKYKFIMWFYYLTFQDIKDIIKEIKNIIKIIFYKAIEVVAIILSFILLFVIPAFLH
jgi:hypothetical protein